jgi:phenylacetate-CoA ligase
VMTLKAEAVNPDIALHEAVSTSLRSITNLGGNVSWAAPHSLPNDGKIIADERA